MALLCGLISWYFTYIPLRLPLSLDIAFMAVFFMSLGYLIRNINFRLYFIPILIVITAVCYLFNKECIWNMRLMDYGMPLLYMAGSSSFSVLLILICKFVSSLTHPKCMKPILFIGKNSVWFLIFNNFYINMLNLFFESLNIIIPKWCMFIFVMVLLFRLL